MSRYGLIVGKNGNIQFDTQRQTLGLMEHGYVNETGWTIYSTYNGTYMYTYVFPNNYNIIATAVKPNYNAFVACATGSSTYFPGGGLIQSGRDPLGGITEASAGPIEYAAYSPDVNQIHGIPSWGLVTYNENGEIVFNSDIRYIKIRNIIDINRSAILNFEDITIEHDELNPFYIVPHGYCETWEYSPGPGGGGVGIVIRLLGAKKIDNYRVKIGWFVSQRSGPVYGGSFFAPPVFRVPDPLRIAVCVL